jgi:hypothetical protein
VEGPSELIYLKTIGGFLEAEGKTAMHEDITIVPAGGLDKVVTFIALLGASGLQLAVLHDYHGVPEQSLMDLVKRKMISQKAILNVSQFRDIKKLGATGQPSDIEDLFEVDLYLDYFNKAYSKQLKGSLIKSSDLPPGDRIVERIERHLKDKAISLRPSGGFNHYLVASQFASDPPGSVDKATIKRFEALFAAVNTLFDN